MEDRLAKIAIQPIFQALKPDELQVAGSKIHDRNYRKGMIIFLEGEPADNLFVIYSGKVKLTVTSEQGQEKIIQIVKQGDILGEVAAFDQGAYPVTAEVMEDAAIGMISADELLKLVQQCPAISLNLLKIMSRRLRQLQRQVKNLALKDAYGRLASRLFKLARDHGNPDEQGVTIGLALTHQDLANFIGTSRETVSRILREFEKANVISVNKQFITILDGNKLKEWM